MKRLIAVSVALALCWSAPSSAWWKSIQQSNGSAGSVITTTFDPAHKSSNITLSGGNLTATAPVGAGGVWNIAFGTVSKSTGKFYDELTISSGNLVDVVGYANNSVSTFGTGFAGNDLNGVGWVNDGRVLINGATVATIGTWGLSTHVLSRAIDLGNSEVWFRVDNGNWNNNPSADPATNAGGISISSLNAGPYYPVITPQSTSMVMTEDFGATGYSETQPSGFGNWQ